MWMVGWKQVSKFFGSFRDAYCTKGVIKWSPAYLMKSLKQLNTRFRVSRPSLLKLVYDFLLHMHILIFGHHVTKRYEIMLHLPYY